MVLPEPVLSDDEIKVAAEEYRNQSGLISNTWSTDPTKLAVLRAMASCLTRFGFSSDFDTGIVGALAQKWVRSLHSYPLEVEEAP